MAWPGGVETADDFVNYNSALLYDNDDTFDEDAEDLHKAGIKVNGLVGQLHWMQQLSWVMILIQITNLYALIIPMMRSPGDLILNTGVTFLAVLVLVGNVACCLTQSADPAVFGTKRWSKEEYLEYITIKYRDLWKGEIYENFKFKDQIEGVRTGEKRWCPMCHVIVNRESYHCHSSNKCVEGMDHFCKWLNASIGSANYKFFKLFSLSCFWISVVQFSSGMYEFSDSFEDPDFYQTRMIAVYDTSASGAIHWFRAFSFISTLLSFVAILQLGYLYGFHVMLYRLDYTTVTYWHQKKCRETEMTEYESGAPVEA